MIDFIKPGRARALTPRYIRLRAFSFATSLSRVISCTSKCFGRSCLCEARTVRSVHFDRSVEQQLRVWLQSRRNCVKNARPPTDRSQQKKPVQQADENGSLRFSWPASDCQQIVKISGTRALQMLPSNLTVRTNKSYA